MSKLAKENCPHTYKTLVNRRKQTGASWSPGCSYRRVTLQIL
jgi:hypothetical protein